MNPITFKPTAPVFGVTTQPSRQTPIPPSRDRITFGSLDALYELRLKRHEADLQAPAISNRYGSVTLLQVLTAISEAAKKNGNNYIIQQDFIQEVVDPEDAEQLQTALQQLEKMDLLVRPYSDYRYYRPSETGEAAIRLLQDDSRDNAILT